jgi:hypothetical protein
MNETRTVTEIQSPRDTRGWRVVDPSAGRTWIDAEGTGYRQLRDVEGTEPDVVLTYDFTPSRTLLRRLGPRQLAERLAGGAE